ncbi:MAG: thioesterase family protein [Chloroflexota bacterium]
MLAAIQPGLTATLTLRVEPAHLASRWGSGGVDVLATPQMIGLMESAAVAALDAHLPEGYCSVGTRVEVTHLAATPVGGRVAAQATLIELDGRRAVFDVVAHDEVAKIGEGRHERFIVHRERFMARVGAPR